MENAKEEGRNSEPEEISVKERVDDGARGERRTLKEEAALRAEALVGRKGEGLRHRPAWILQGWRLKRRGIKGLTGGK